MREKIYVFARGLTLFAVLNTPIILYSWIYYLPRAAFNIDYTLAIILYMLHPKRWVFLGAFIIILTVDFTTGSATVYHFHAPIDFFKSVEFISNLHISESIIFWIPVLLIFTTVLYCISGIQKKLGNHRPTLANILIICTIPLTFTLLDYLNGSLSISSTNIGKTSINLSGSAARILALSIYNSKTKRELTPIQHNGALASFFYKNKNTSNNSIIFILVESFGLPKNQEIPNDWLHYLKRKIPESSHQILSQTIEFKGATTDGELRELCQLQGTYYLINEDIASNCIPNLLKAAGYKTHAYHGFNSSMFSRNIWWEKIGLEDHHFGQELIKELSNSCGGIFRGACDQDVISYAFKNTSEHGDFSYILTLNGHLPLVESEIPEDHKLFCKKHQMAPTICLLNSSYLKIFDQIAKSIKKESSNKISIIVVGDHAPPFTNKSEREYFSQNLVPAFFITPK